MVLLNCYAAPSSDVDTIRIIEKTRIDIYRYPAADSIICAPASITRDDYPSDDKHYDEIRITKHRENELSPDSTAVIFNTFTTTYARKETEPTWWKMMLRGQLNLKDTTIVYPKFVGLCVKVYNWADKFFNTYDPEYVEGTGRRWKAYLKNDNLLDSYAMTLGHKMNIRMMSNITANLGPYLQYMAVSVGYQWDMTNIISNQPQNMKRWDFGFTCALFSANLFYWTNTGGNVIRTFGDYNNGHLIYAPISGVSMSSLGIDLYYFLNNKRYSEGAAYGFSKIQKRSQGSFIFGFSYGDQSINIDFRTLPAHLLPYLTINPADYNFHYKNYCLLIGYGYNLVFSKRWILNVTAVPSIGINHCYEDSLEGARNILSMNIKGKMALVYNLHDFFTGVTMKMDGHWYRSHNYSLFNATETLSLCVGYRF
ncbi:MAG: DUF4421 domain-containing protein [Prevotella sp.]|nr:DUF4421 domain-containing protein [Bacteroides sp.]MCM1366968.1 DUF4421 domain-containing protein [Prevotella sp.]MCM1436752.1 DUF4421 domain-containing protein [Prevotella sp.]